jgi:hypothetical protein
MCIKRVIIICTVDHRHNHSIVYYLNINQNFIGEEEYFKWIRFNYACSLRLGAKGYIYIRMYPFYMFRGRIISNVIYVYVSIL